ncbi:hypothetical protein LTR62_001291 [Meristemomyces frigidus]|uniref:Uncharacterized protein n=1 Tax=Meristemomyces frigidus TaxID=1508187 RepID=A0AAN7YBQ2_9PEZI|nr:hypothetical protein LTR62_001291 [Meristemomyces frigidus]
MANPAQSLLCLSSILFIFSAQVNAQSQCYYDVNKRGPSPLIPCAPSGQSTCCLLGDVCLSGNACFNYTTGNTYQYGCTDALSPWVGLNFCSDIPDPSNSSRNRTNTWVCEAPESCGCKWGPSNPNLFVLPPRDCPAMGDEARVALLGPNALPPWVLLPTSAGGSTGYYRTSPSGTTTVYVGPVSGYTPNPVQPLATYSVPDSITLANGKSYTGSGGGGSTTTTSVTSTLTSATGSSSGGSGSAGGGGGGTTSEPPATSRSNDGTTSPSTTPPPLTSLPSTSPSPSPTSTQQSISSISLLAPLNPASTSVAPVPPTGLSTGAKAGIAIAAAVLAGLVAVGIFLCLRHPRRGDANRTNAVAAAEPPDPSEPMQQRRNFHQDHAQALDQQPAAGMASRPNGNIYPAPWSVAEPMNTSQYSSSAPDTGSSSPSRGGMQEMYYRRG